MEFILHHIYLIISAAVIAVLIFSFLHRGTLIYAVIMSFIKKPTTGRRGMIGKTGKVISPLDPKGKVFVHGELWNARSGDSGIIEKDAAVEVSGVDGLELVVKKK